MNTNAIGAHVSIAGGIQHAPLRAQAEGCETFQCFTRSPQGGPAPKLTPELVEEFHANREAANIQRWVIHAPYYINLASLESRIRQSSIRIIREELERGSALGASFVMFHPGSYRDQTQEAAIQSVSNALESILDNYQGNCKLLVEISAGAGNVLGDTFEENAAMMKTVQGHSGFGGICFDTCHAFASGYDFRTPEQARTMLKEFDRTIGLKWLALSHVQDSQADLGGRKDRHEHLGDGYIGKEGIASLLTTPEFQSIDWILETEAQNRPNDIAILQKIRSGGNT